MSCSIIVARKEMYKMFRDRWVARSASIANGSPSYIPYVYYDGLTTKKNPPTNLFHVELQMISGKETPACFRTNVDGLQNQRYNCTGVLECCIFCPLTDVKNADKGYNLSVVARDAYSAKESPSGVHFYDVSIKGPIKYNDTFAKFLIKTDYQYFDVRTSA